MSVKKYPILYAKSNTGKTLIWRMEQENEKFRTISGQQDSEKLVTSEWTIAEPKNVGKKNATTAEQQAESEINNKYKKQLKSGGYFKDIKDIDSDQFFQVTLAKSFGDYEDKINWSEGCGVQVKYNGSRLIARKEGLFTRKGEKYVSVPHIEEGLKLFFEKYPEAVLDGEAYNWDLRERLNELMKLVRKSVHATAEDLAASKEMVKYYIYDGFGFGATQKDGYLKRKEIIDKTFLDNKEYKDIYGHVPTWIVKSKKELDELYNKFLDDKQEGAIIRILNQPYENKRSKYLLKYKPVDDAEYKVIDIQEGEGNWAGVAKIITCERIDGKYFDDTTKTFNATFKGTYEEAAECLKNKKKYLNKVVTIYYNGFTGKGKPNYARFDINNYQKS